MIKVSRSIGVPPELLILASAILTSQSADGDIIQSRTLGKDLALVEWAFRSCKTTHLEMRPIYVHLEKRTRAHALVVMLAYHLIKELRARWQPLNITVEEGIMELSQFCSTEVH